MCGPSLHAIRAKVKYWLTFNEINAVDLAPYMGAGLLDSSLQSRAQAAHDQFVASALAVKLAHEIDKNMQVGMMLAYQPVYPYTCDPADQIKVMEYNQKDAFYADVQAGGCYPNYKLKEYEREGITLDISPEDHALLKDYPVDFISFSCYGSNVLTTHEKKPLIVGI